MKPNDSIMAQEFQNMKKRLDEIEKLKKKDKVVNAKQNLIDYANTPGDVHGGGINADLLHQKVLSLEEAARTTDHVDKDKITAVLNIFLRNKKLPNAGQLIVNLLSTTEEAKLLERERKFVKMGQELEKNDPQTPGTPTKGQTWEPPSGCYPPNSPFMGWATPWGPQFPSPQFPRPPAQGSRPPRRTPNYVPRQGQKCHHCGEEGHFRRDCHKRMA